MTRPEARAAACWWASRLGNCTHDAGMRTVADMELTLSINADSVRGRFGAETVLAFAEQLEQLIDAELGDDRLVIAVEYDPCGMLCEAARAAGIELHNDLPVKTRMIVKPGEIRVKEGYSAGWVTAWEAAGVPGQ